MIGGVSRVHRRLASSLRPLGGSLARRHRWLRRRARLTAKAGRLATRRRAHVAEYVTTAQELLEHGHSKLPVVLLDRAEELWGPHPEVTRLRRKVPRYLGRAPRRHVLAVASELVGRRLRWSELSTEPVRGGRSWATIAIVRHAIGPDEGSFIRKSLHLSHPREAEFYRSDLTTRQGSRWRSPTVYATHHTGTHWHLYLEDLGKVRRPRTQPEFVDAARALAELAAGLRGYRSAAPWLRPFTPPRIPPTRQVSSMFHQLAPAGLVERLAALYPRLHELEPALVTTLRTRPTALCHGDARAGNIVLDPANPGGIVLIDWGFVQITAPGVDLGNLLSMPHMAAGRGSLDPDACVDAYLDVLDPDPTEEHHIRQAYRHQLVYRSLRWCAARARHHGKPLREADLERICDAANWLLAEHDGHLGPPPAAPIRS